jgi:RNA polymerase sigma-70 factor (ECF subfamily)
MGAMAESPSILIEPVGHTSVEPCSLDPGARATMGRGEECELRVDDRQVSKKHVLVEFTDGDWYLTDLGSSNGTRLNRWTLEPNNPVRLRDGDSFAIGPCEFRIAVSGAAPAEPTSSSSGPVHTGTYATRASIFLRLRDERRDVQELGWEEFRERYAPVIVGYCRNAGLRSQDAEDILQDVMLGFFRLSPEFEYDPSKGRFRGYLKRATLNAIRKRARHNRGSVDISDEWLADQEASAEAWDSRWSEQVVARALAEARCRFDDRTVEAFELYGQRGMPAEAVATRLQMNVNSVHQAKSRVLSVVRAVVERVHADEG